MTDDRIQQLNKLNHQFYSDSAVSFSQTRTSQWEGWSRALPEIEKRFLYCRSLHQKPQVLDVGCGNGRFLDYLHNTAKLEDFCYHGVDLSDTLLSEAASIAIDASIERKLAQVDLVTALPSEPNELFPLRYDLIAVFGVMHHLPSFALRQHLLESAWKALEPGGIFIVTFWQFANGARFHNQKNLSSTSAIKSTDQFSAHDYLLSWQEKPAARYAHHFTKEEITKLLQPFPTEAISDQFSADGKEQLNHYVILKKHI